MTPQQAVDGPRWLYGRSWGAPSNSLKLERGFDSQVYANLQSAATMWRWSTATRTSWAMPALSSSATAQLMTGRQFSAGLQIRAATVLPAATDAMPTQQR